MNLNTLEFAKFSTLKNTLKYEYKGSKLENLFLNKLTTIIIVRVSSSICFSNHSKFHVQCQQLKKKKRTQSLKNQSLS